MARKWFQYSPGEVLAEQKKASRTAMRWGSRKGTIWADGARLDDGRVVVECVW